MVILNYYIHSLTKNTYFVVDTFDQMIDWFARHNKGCYQGLDHWDKPVPLDPKRHSYRDYNWALNHIAMNVHDMEVSYKYPLSISGYTSPVELTQRDIMVIDEYDRVIDPRTHWDKIATCVVKYSSYKKKKHPYAYRCDPVPRTGGKWRRESALRHPQTTQERRKAADPKIKQYVKPSRNFINLPTTWDDIWRNRNQAWKAKKMKKQWMKHI